MRYLIAYTKKFTAEEMRRSANELLSAFAINVSRGYLAPIGKEHENAVGVPCLVLKTAGRGEANKRLIVAKIARCDFGKVTDSFVDVHFDDPQLGTFRFAKSSPVVFEVPVELLRLYNKVHDSINNIVERGAA